MLSRWRKWVSALAELVRSFEDTLTTRKVSPLIALDQWREMPIVGPQRSHVWDKERELFLQIPSGMVDWNMRKEHLVRLAKAEQLNLSMILPTYLTLLIGADEYSLFRSQIDEMDEMADRLDMKFKVLGSSSRMVVGKERTPQVLGDAPCFSCGMLGHRARNCPKAKPGEGCFLCGKAGHIARHCEQGKGNVAGNKCFNCGENGHFANVCPKKVSKTESTNGPRGSPGLGRAMTGPMPGPEGVQPPTEDRRKPPLYVTKAGRTSKPPERLGMLAGASRVVALPCRLGSFETQAVVDSGSDFNMMATALVERLGLARYPVEPCAVGTILGPLWVEEGAEVEVAVQVDGTWVQRKMECRVCPSLPVDVTLGIEWLADGTLSVTGREGVAVAVLNDDCPKRDASVQVGGVPLCLFSISEEAMEITESTGGLDETVLSIPTVQREATETGPLTREQLLEIRDVVDDPEIGVDIIEERRHPVIRRRGYPQSAERQKAARLLLGQLEEAGYLRQTDGVGHWTSPGFCVPKPNGKVRLVVDYRDVNDRIRKGCVPYQSHSLTEWRESLRSDSKYYATIDIKDAFHRLRLDPASRKYLTMSIQMEDGHRNYEWLVLPMGLTTAPFHWCAFVTSVMEAIENFRNLHSDLEQVHESHDAYCVVYADDILIAGPTLQSVTALLHIVLQVMRFLGCLISVDKIQPPATQVRAMGLQLESGYLRPDPEMVAKIRGAERPKDKESLRSFLGLIQYVAGFVEVQKWFAVGPLQRLLTQRVQFSWGPEEEAAWEDLVVHFRSIPIGHFSLTAGEESLHNKQLILQTDASDDAYGGAVWVIKDTPGDERKLPDLARCGDAVIVGLYHKRFSPQERRYPGHDREGVAIFNGLVRIRALIYLFGQRRRPIWVLSDNICALARMKSQYGEDVNMTRSRRWLRWQNELADIAPFVKFKHVAGPENGIADWLSRSIDTMMGVAERSCQTDATVLAMAGISITSPTHELEFANGGVTQIGALHTPIGGVEESYDTSEEAGSPEDPIGGVANATPEGADAPVGGVVAPLLDEEQRMYSELVTFFSLWDNEVGAGTGQTLYCGISLSDIYAYLRRGCNTSPKTKRLADKRFRIGDSGALLFKCGTTWAIAVPNITMNSGGSLRSYLVWLVHEGGEMSCHRGIQTTLAKLRNRFWWPGMDTMVYTFVRTCMQCITARAGQLSRAGVHTGVAISEPNERVIFDFCQSRGATILVGVDCFSNFILAREVISKDATSVCEFLLDWVGLFGCFGFWSSDWESTFVSQSLRQLRKFLGVAEYMGSTYSPATQGQVERAVGTVKQALAACVDRPVSVVVRAAVFANNSTPRPQFANISPAEVFLGRKMREPSMLFTEEMLGDGIVEAVADLREYWRSRINEERQRTSDESLITHNDLGTLGVGQTAVRVVFDHLDPKPKIRRYGVYRIEELAGSGYWVVPLEGGQRQWLPGHQLCAYDHEMAQELRRGLTPSGWAPGELQAQDGPQVGEEWAFAWTTDEGIKLYIGKVVERSSSTCGVRYREQDGGRLGYLTRAVVSTPLRAADHRGRTVRGRWVPSVA